MTKQKIDHHDKKQCANPVLKNRRWRIVFRKLWDQSSYTPQNEIDLISHRIRKQNILKRIASEKPVRNKSSIRSLYIQVAAAVIGLLILFTVSYNLFVEIKENNFPLEYVSVKDTSRINLPDGSLVKLYPNSTLSIDKEFNDHTRSLLLNGIAEFHVFRDTKRPFIVKTDKMKVQVLGTVFEVNGLTSVNQNHVKVRSGRVSVQILPKNIKIYENILSANQSLTFNRNNDQINFIDAALASNYNSRLILEFNGESLGSLVQKIREVYKVNVSLDNELKDKGIITGKFEGQSLEQVLNTLQQVVPFNYKIIGNQVFIKRNMKE